MAVVGLPCRQAGYATGMVLPRDVGVGVSGAPLLPKMGQSRPIKRGMGRFGTTPAGTVKVPFGVCTVMRIVG